MQTWKTILVAVLLVIVGGYAYYVSRQPTEQTPKLNQISAGDIQKIELRSRRRDIVVERSADGWRNAAGGKKVGCRPPWCIRVIRRESVANLDLFALGLRFH